MSESLRPDEPSVALESLRVPLRRLYDELDSALAEVGPVCRLSGRCCRFQEFDHTLFVSEPEVALLLADAPAPARPLDDGATCPWQDQHGHCRAHDARPLGCRLFYCDASYQGHAEQLSHRFHRRLKDLVEALELPWNYAPLHQHLQEAQARGAFPRVVASTASTTPAQDASVSV